MFWRGGGKRPADLDAHLPLAEVIREVQRCGKAQLEDRALGRQADSP